MGRRTESGNRFNAAQSKVVSANKKPEEAVKEQVEEGSEKIEKTDEIIETTPAPDTAIKDEKISEKETELKQPTAKNTGNIFSKQKKEHGVQQSVYLKKEVYDYCQSISEEHGIKFSDVINTIVLEYMEQN